jgi:hypothetical protein
MKPLRLVALTALTMIAFAGNSLFCRMALKETGIDAASFTSVRWRYWCRPAWKRRRCWIRS